MKICVWSRPTRTRDCEPRAFPRVFHLGQRRHPVVAVLEQWTEAQYEYFKVRVEDGRRFVLRRDASTGSWELAAAYGGERLPAAAAVRI